MAIIKFTNSKAELKTIIDYVTRADKTNANLITGKDCVANSCLEEMKTVKEFYNKNQEKEDKKKEKKSIINKILTTNHKYLLIVIYLILIIPAFIDFVIFLIPTKKKLH